MFVSKVKCGLYLKENNVFLIIYTYALTYHNNRDSETREVKSLDGIWNFVQSNVSNPTEGIQARWFERDLCKSRPTIRMPVPASYNDITEDAALRDHVGTVWYDRKFFVPQSWSDERRVWIRFGSVHYEAIVVSGLFVICNMHD